MDEMRVELERSMEERKKSSLFPDTPQTLLLKIRSGALENATLWRRVDEMYRPVVEKFIRQQIGGALRSHSDDLAAEVLYRLYFHVSGFDRFGRPIKGYVKQEGAKFRSYVATMAKHLCKDLYRKETSRGLGRTVSFDESFGDGAQMSHEAEFDVAQPLEDQFLDKENATRDQSDLDFQELWIASIVELAIEESLSMPMDQERHAALTDILIRHDDPKVVAQRYNVKENTLSQWKTRIKKQIKVFLDRYRDDDESFGKLLAEKRPERYMRLMDMVL